MTINNVQSQNSNSINGDTMQYYITKNPRFQGAYIAHTPDGSFECANIYTARSYIPNTREYRQAQSAMKTASTVKQPTIACQGFVSPSGQYYAVVSLQVNQGGYESISDIRIDCHNVHTLRTWMRDGVTHSTLIEALKDHSNVRMQGGWGA